VKPCDKACPSHTPRRRRTSGGRGKEKMSRGDEHGLELGEPSSTPFDWTMCQSEGGPENCALCSHAEGGGLPCHMFKPAPMSNSYCKCPDECRDDKMSIMKGYWWAHGGPEWGVRGGGQCLDFTSKRPLPGVIKGFAFFNFNSALGHNAKILTKGWLTHPTGACKPIGIFMFKRVVSHKCTGKGTNPNACKKVLNPNYSNSTCHEEKPLKCPSDNCHCEYKMPIVADVYKVGFCINCTPTKFRFRSRWAMYIGDLERQRFGSQCLAKAFDEKGELKKGFECEGKDLALAEAEIMGF